MTFRHHPDGWIYLDDFVCTLAEFTAQRPAYALAAPATSRSYDGTLHVLSDGQRQWGGPVPWPDGEEYLTDAAAIEAAVTAARQPPPPTLAQAQAAKMAAIDAHTGALMLAGFSYTPAPLGAAGSGGGAGAYTFPLDQASLSVWQGLLTAAQSGLLTYPQSIGTADNRLAALTSAADVQAFYAAGLARAQAILTGAVQLKAQVQAATTVGQVNAVSDTRS